MGKHAQKKAPETVKECFSTLVLLNHNDYISTYSFSLFTGKRCLKCQFCPIFCFFLFNRLFSYDGRNDIRINDQYRICFQVEGNNFFDVEIVDYH